MAVNVGLCFLALLGLSQWRLVGSSPTSEGEDAVVDIELGDVRRPVWNVAHMVNALYQLDLYLEMGANSVEFDVAFDWEGTAKFTFHGFPCDCFRTCFKYESIVPYIEYLRQLTTPGDPKFQERLSLLFMDAKVSGLSSSAKYRAGVDVATKMLDHYWKRGTSGARGFLLLSIPSVKSREFLDGFRNTLDTEGFSQYHDRIGVDFSGNEDLDLISRTLDSLKIQDHVWQGDGITNCLPRGTSRLRNALVKRDTPKTSTDKVYWWTVDKMSTMRAVLRLGVDAMITNYPERLVKVLAEEEFSKKFRMATFADNPWTKYASPLSALTMKESLMARGGNITQEDVMLENGDVMLENGEDLLYNC